METKKVDIQIDVSRTANPNWRKLWDILLRPPADKPGLEIKEARPAQIHSSAAVPEKPIEKPKPEQLSLFPLDKSKPERDDIRPQIHKEA